MFPLFRAIVKHKSKDKHALTQKVGAGEFVVIWHHCQETVRKKPKLSATTYYSSTDEKLENSLSPLSNTNIHHTSYSMSLNNQKGNDWIYLFLYLKPLANGLLDPFMRSRGRTWWKNKCLSPCLLWLYTVCRFSFWWPPQIPWAFLGLCFCNKGVRQVQGESTQSELLVSWNSLIH